MLLIVVALLAGACGADSDGASEEAPAPAVAAASEPTPAPSASPTTPTSTVESSASTTTEPPAPSVRALESNYEEPPGPGGWTIPAGDWVSHSFSPPASFSLPVDATVINEGAGRIELAVGDPAAPSGFLTIAQPLAINTPTGPVPIGIAEPAELFEPYDLRGQRSAEVDGRTLDIYDVSFPEDPAFASFRSPCDRSPGYRCLDALVTLSYLVFLEQDAPHRFVSQEWEDGSLVVIATSLDGDTDVLDLADDVASTVVAMPGEEHDSARWLSSLGDRADSIPAGRYVGRVGETPIAVTFDDELDAARVFAQRPTVLGVTTWVEEDWGSGHIRLFDFDDFIDPETGELPSDRRATPMSTSDFEAGLRERVIVEATGTSVFAGVDAAWFDIIAEQGVGESCAVTLGWSNPDATCVEWSRMLNPYRILQPSDVVTRVYYLESVDLLVTVMPEPGHTVDDVLVDLDPFVAGLEVLTP